MTPPGPYDDALVPGFSRRLLASLALVVLAASCSGGDGDGDGGAGPTGQGGGTGEEPRFGFAVTGAEVQAMAPQAPPFPDDVKAGVTAGLDAYLGLAVVDPLRTGKPPGGLEQAFTAPALARLSAPGPDRAALVEEGSPLSGEVRQERANAKLTALTAPGGEIVLVTAQVEAVHVVRSDGGSVAVGRSGELVLVADGGAWRVDAFDMRTSRDAQPGGGR